MDFSLLQQSEFELELIQTQMTQKPMLRAEVYALALRASQNRKEDSAEIDRPITGSDRLDCTTG